jgi:hypothetical protein
MNENREGFLTLAPHKGNLAEVYGPGPASGFENGLMLACIALSPFQDTALQKTFLGMAGASFSFFPMIILLFIAVARWALQKHLMVGRSALIISAYVCIVCAANLVWINNGEAVIYWKSLRGFPLLTALILFAVFGMNYRARRGIRIAVYVAFCLTMAGIACGQLFGANAIPMLQATPHDAGRTSGFSSEASTLSVQLVAIGMLTAHFLRRHWQKWFVGTLTCVLLVFCDSKGGLIALLLCAIVLGIAKGRSSTLAKIAIAFILLPSIYFGALFVLAIFGKLMDANLTATIATRLSMPVYAAITVAHNPFGVGFTGFLPSIPRYLPAAMSFVQDHFPIPLFFEEVQGYQYPPQADADCKAFFFDYLVFFGIPFAIVFIRFVGKLLIRLFNCECYWLFVGTLFSVIAMMTYYAAINAWTLPLLLGISLHEIRRIERSTRERELPVYATCVA